MAVGIRPLTPHNPALASFSHYRIINPVRITFLLESLAPEPSVRQMRFYEINTGLTNPFLITIFEKSVLVDFLNICH